MTREGIAPKFSNKDKDIGILGLSEGHPKRGSRNQPKGKGSAMGAEYRVKPMEMGKVYCVGHEAMDRQHERLFALINKLVVMQEASEEEQRAALKAVFPKIADFAVRHFRSEERLMDKMGWPGAEEHKKLHAKLLADVEAMLGMIRAAKPGTLDEVTLKEAVLFLKDWLFRHILVVDQKYGAEIKAKSPVPQDMGMEDLAGMPMA